MISFRDEKKQSNKYPSSFDLIVWKSGEVAGDIRGNLKPIPLHPRMLRTLEDSGRKCHRVGPPTQSSIKMVVGTSQPTKTK